MVELSSPVQINQQEMRLASCREENSAIETSWGVAAKVNKLLGL